MDMNLQSQEASGWGYMRYEKLGYVAFTGGQQRTAIPKQKGDRKEHVAQ
jgi:hypothetical protein